MHMDIVRERRRVGFGVSRRKRFEWRLHGRDIDFFKDRPSLGSSTPPSDAFAEKRTRRKGVGSPRSEWQLGLSFRCRWDLGLVKSKPAPPKKEGAEPRVTLV